MGAYFLKKQARSPILEGFGRNIYALLSFSGQQYFVFEFASVLQWLSKEYAEPRMADFAEVISTSMRQLLPYEGHLCGIAKSGFYPEVVQHTNWDYGKNGKGYYNDIFAPGWTVASLWELLTPGRAERFLLD